MNSMKFFVFTALILVFTIINSTYYYSLIKENFVSGLVSNSSISMAKMILKDNLFSGKKCLTKKELKKSINRNIDNYFPIYSGMTGKKKVCMADLEAYIKDV